MSELKPCAHCANLAIIDERRYGDYTEWAVQCSRCLTRSDYYSSREAAVAAWNRRADDAPEQPVDNGADVVAILRKYATFWGVSHATNTQCDSDWEITTMRALADMIERDYVRRDSIADDAPISEKPVSSLKESAEDTQVLTDSREKLEADIDRELKENYKGTHAERHYTRELIVGWLDRQAAITERETVKQWEEQASELVCHANKLQEQVNSLTAECDRLREKMRWVDDMNKNLREELRIEREAVEACEGCDIVGKLTAECDELKAEISKYEHDCGLLFDEKDKLTADAKRWADAANRQRLVAMEQADKVQELTAERNGLSNAVNKLRRRVDGMFCLNDLSDKRIKELEAEVEAQRKRANDAERGVLSEEWYISRERYDDDMTELRCKMEAEHNLRLHWKTQADELTAERDELKERVAQFDSISSLDGVANLLVQLAELTAEREKLLAELEAYSDFEKAEFAIPLDEAMEFTTDPPGYIKKHIAELQAERDNLQGRLEAEIESLKRANRIQADSFQKLERELTEARAK